MIEILQNTQATLDIIFSGGYADGTVTATVRDADGATVVSGNATKDLAVAGRYTYVLPPQTAPMWLTVTWAGTFGGIAQSIATGAGQTDGTASEVQVTGGHLFTVSQLRAFAGGDLTSSTTYPDETLIATRSEVTALFEDYTNVAFVNRYGRTTLDGGLSRTLWLPNQKINSLRAVTVNGVALSAGELAQIGVYPNGKLYRLAIWPWSTTPRNIVVSYEHGYMSSPEDITRAALILAHYELTTSQLADRYLSMSNDLGIIRLSIPSYKDCRPTGIPLVDETLNRYCQQPALV